MSAQCPKCGATVTDQTPSVFYTVHDEQCGGPLEEPGPDVEGASEPMLNDDELRAEAARRYPASWEDRGRTDRDDERCAFLEGYEAGAAAERERCAPDRRRDSGRRCRTRGDAMSDEWEWAVSEAADYLRGAAQAAAQAQREHDLAEGLPLIGTSTANEIEWYQIGNWAHTMLTALIARRRNSMPSADDVARGALDPGDYERLTGEIRAAKTDVEGSDRG